MSSDIWIHVVAAVIENDKRQLLIAKRPKDKHQGGLWEFPGGKVEAHEDPVQALKRELKEELNISVDAAQPFIKIRHRYPDKSILLDVYQVRYVEGEGEGQKAIGNEGQEIQWVNFDQINNFEFPKANQKILKAISSPQKLSILPADFNADKLSANYLKFLHQHKIDGIFLRCPLLDDDAYIALYKSCKSLLSAQVELKSIKVFINRPSLLSMLDSNDGLHLSRDELMNSLDVFKLKSSHSQLTLSASCHNESELEKAEKLDCDFVFISPLKHTSSHPEAIPLGWEVFTLLLESTYIPTLALGGVSLDDIAQVKDCGGFGVAGISHFGARS